MNKTKVGIIASGLMGQKHMDALRRIPGVEVLAIADPMDAKLDKKAEKMGIPYAFSDYKEMIEKIPLDVIHNCTPNKEHYEINKYIIEKGIHIYSEKPLGIHVKEAEELFALAKEKKVAHGVNFNYRNNAMVQEMKMRIQTKDAGKCFLVHGSYLQDWLMYQEDYNWRIQEEEGGKSRAAADIGSHYFDTVQTILGKKIEKVYAKLLIAHPSRKKLSASGETFSFGKESEDALKGAAVYEEIKVTTEDMGMVMLQFTDGTMGTLVLSQVSGGYKNAFCISVDCANYSMRWNQEEADHLIIGSREKGEIKLYAAQGGMTGNANLYATLPAGHPVGWADALYNGINCFYQSIKEDSFGETEQPYATFEDGIAVMRIVDACVQSSNEDKWITIR